MTTPLPAAPNSVTRPSTFNTDADAFLAALVLYQQELDAYQATLSPIGKNLLINPAFAIDQRNAGASTAIANDNYAFDRWNILTQTGTVAALQLTDQETGYPFAMRLTQSQASAQRFGFSQIIEGKNCKHLRGNSGTLVPRCRLSVSSTLRYAILGWTGTEDAVISNVVNSWTNSTFTAGQFFNSTTLSVLGTGSFAASANTWANLTALTAALGTTFTNIIVFVWTDSAQAQNVTLDVDYVQFEGGATATAFERRTTSHELSNCLRYFRKYGTNSINDVYGVGCSFSTTGFEANFAYEEMRASPSAAVVNPTDFTVYSGTHTGPFACTVVSAAQALKKSCRVICTTAAVLTGGQSGHLLNATGIALITLDAEL